MPGGVINHRLWGVTIAQASAYYQTYSDDKKFLTFLLGAHYCAFKTHTFDTKDIKDSYQPHSEAEKWEPCEEQPCPNRYDLKSVARTASTSASASTSSPAQPLLSTPDPTPHPKQEPEEEPEPDPAPNSSSSAEPPNLPKPEDPEDPEDLEDPDNPDNPTDPDQDSDSDDNNMSKVIKAFDKVTILKKDSSNWDTWKARVKRAAKTIKHDKYLFWNPQIGSASESNDDEIILRAGTEEEKEQDSDLLNAIIGRLSDEIFQRYKNHDSSSRLWTNLIEDFESKNALTKSHLQRQLHTMRCYNPSKVNEHLDEMLDVRDSLDKRGISIPDEMFVNTITASVPDTFKPTINALIIVYSKSDRTLKSSELISTIQAESVIQQRSTMDMVTNLNQQIMLVILVAEEDFKEEGEAHCILGHQNYVYVKHMFNNNQVGRIKLDPNQMEEPECHTCLLAKATRFPIAKIRTTPRAEKYGDIFHMDVWGPAAVKTQQFGWRKHY
ncbi:hypothetical protein D9757_012011 [Collybiopsis confluens]|uniref:Uncharacterized protein n=1 Tax=Collybiopsis confluens TaxID=2823264 RepID=A0A8H5GS57_9AGAR|nr:hypothetical protein D9757_012011 [Collybiopsis confluens]